jgi:hypothetical protein
VRSLIKLCSSSRSWPARLGLPALLALAGCVGDIGDGDDPLGEAVDPVCNPGPAPMRRLTRWEYNNTVADLLGDTTAPASSFVPEAGQFGFDNAAAGATLSDVVVEQFESAARELAANAVTDLPALLACDVATTGEDDCAARFIEHFGRRVFRRPLAEDELARYRTLYDTTKESYGFEKAIELVLSGMLQSPHFLYRIEIENSAAGAVVPVRSYEMATRLSYFLWGTAPDEALLDAAENGELETPADVAREARRMIEHDHGTRAVKNFFGQWAKLRDLPLIERDEAIFPGETPALMQEELDRYVEDVFRATGTWKAMMTEPATFLNEELASYYGIEGVTGDWQRVELDPARYPGILTRGGLLAVLGHPDQPSPVLRGKFIREQIFCDPPPPPPCDADTTLPPIDPEATARQQLEQKTSGDACIGCHSFLNPPGFAFDHFDQVGKWRETDHGLEIDTTGDLVMTDVDGEFEGHVDLIERFAESAEAESCMTTHWFRYAYGRGVTEADTCTQEDLSAMFAESGGDLRELMVSLTQTKAFLFRAPASGDAQ